MTPSHLPVALVTGASRGLGRGIACRLAELGLSVVVNYAGNREAAEETVRACERLQADPRQRFLALRADVGAASDREALVGQTLASLGRLDAFVSNAGIGPRRRADITETSEESFKEVLRVNLEGPFFLAQRVANYWLTQAPPPILAAGFRMVFVSSISAATASVNRGEYCVSKAGLSMVSRLWAVRLADHGIQVFEVRPGIMATDMTRGVKEKYDALLAEGIVPQRRWGQPEDVGRAVGAIVMGDLPYATGDVIYLDGGFHISRL